MGFHSGCSTPASAKRPLIRSAARYEYGELKS
jgi:hypothetical protein